MDRAQKLKLVIESVSVLAVVVSLVFVGIEVRQASQETALNTKAAQVSAYQDLITQITDLNYLALTDQEWAALQADFGRSPESVTDPVDRTKYDMYFFLLFRHGDMAFHQFEQGMLTEERLRSAMAPLSGRLPLPLTREFWERSRANFVPSYQAYVDSIIAQVESGAERP